MKIHNVRLGFANNSSSTHSLIFINGRLPTDEVDGGSFGWDYFTASSPESKRNYLYATIIGELQRMMGDDETASKIAAELTGVEPKDDEWYYVDHQSIYTLPRNWSGNMLHRGFFEEFKDFILRDDLVVLGGNDNDGHTHPVAASQKNNTFDLNVPIESSSQNLICREDKDLETGQKYWTLFSRESGAKIRVSFDSPQGFTPKKASRPELVDVKITDYCPFNCEFCYQGSTSKGQHAAKGDLSSIAYDLGKMEVFEVAIGGGEPTMHPDFVDILKSFNHYGIIPNFTTKSLHWLHDPKIWVPVMDMAQSFAFSVENAKQIEDLAAILKVNGIGGGYDKLGKKKVSVQYVMGVGSDYEFDRILRACHKHGLTLTLLGFKTNGRGEEYKAKHDLMKKNQSPNGWIETLLKRVEDNTCPRVGIDTALAQQSLQALEKHNVPKWLYHVEEGKFSAYIDAVEGKVGASSYVPDAELVSAPKRSMTYNGKFNWGQDFLSKTFSQF